MPLLSGKENMKRFSIYLFGLFLGLSLVLSALPGHAQDSCRVNVTIPFDFVVGDKQLEAGDYVVEPLLDGRALKLRSKGGDVQQNSFYCASHQPDWKSRTPAIS